MGKTGRKASLAAIALICFLATVPLTGVIFDNRMAADLVQVQVAVSKLNTEGITSVMLTGIVAGFRGLMVDILWMNSDQAWHEGQEEKFIPIMETITLLDPYFRDGWELLAWHYSYNVMARVATDAEHPEYVWDWKRREKPIKQGLEVCERGLKWNPQHAQLYWYLGTIYYDKMGDYEKAAEWFEKAYECQDRVPFAARNVAHAYERIPDFDKALEWYAKAAEDDPDNPTPPGAAISIKAYYMPAWRLYKSGNFDEAAALIFLRLRQRPDDEIGYHFLGKILEEKGDYETAALVWESAYANNKSDLGALRMAYEVPKRYKLKMQTPKELFQKYEGQPSPSQVTPHF